MQKNNTRNFVCSFLFSVLAVFCIQKVFLRTPDIKQVAPKSDIKLEKISLFAEKNATKADTELLAQSASNPIDVSAISELTVDPMPEPQKVEVAQITEPSVETKTVEPKKAVKEKVYDSTDIAFAEPISLDEQEAEEIKDIENHIQSGVVYAEQNDSNASDVDLAYNDEQEIPLIEDSQVKHQYINISNSSSASQIAMVEPDILINSIEEPDIMTDEKDLADADIKNSELDDIFVLSSAEDSGDSQEDEVDDSAWQKAELGINSSPSSSGDEENTPWVMAKGNKYAKNQAVVEEFSKKEETTEPEQPAEETTPDEQVINQAFSEPLLKEKEPSQNEKLAYQMIQNILIPIPEDILSDTDLTPDLTASPDGKKKETKTIVVTDDTPQEEKQLNEDEKESGLFKSITSWFGKNKQNTPQSAKIQTTQKKSKTKKSEKTAKQKALIALGQLDEEDENEEEEQLKEQPKDPTPIMPAELRLSFQPNRAEISGQTLKWIYAFADNARDNDDVYVEVRIDGTGSYALQQKRLNLLSSIFSARGVDYRKVNTVFTSREPNSFIIRNIRLNNKERERLQTIYTGELIECP